MLFRSRERRFLVSGLPAENPTAVRSITDLYIDGTRIRLRLAKGVVDGVPETQRKLTQKMPDRTGPIGRCGTITTMYLDEAEYGIFAGLRGRWLTKQRLSFPPMGVDVFAGPLAGLMVAEVEFVDDDAMAAFIPPAWCGREITNEPLLTGAHLAAISWLSHEDARAALDSLGIMSPEANREPQG